jgi:predicted Zn finger-like uncharacterized protein
VFRLSAEVLRAAGGQVRCGRCGDVFSALARLAEDSTGFVGGETPLELEERADSILESVGVPQIAQAVAKDYEEFGPPGVEIAHLEVLDWAEDELDEQAAQDGQAAQDEQAADDSPDLERSMEFTLPPGELDRIFIESKKRPLRAVPTPESKPPAEAEPREQAEAPPHPERRIAGYEAAEVSDHVRRDMLEGFEEAVPPAILRRHAEIAGSERRRFVLWLGAAVASALLLMLQIADRYGAIGGAQAAPANFSAYQLRQWGVTGDPDANGTLRVRASILNTAAQLEPYPLLRVTLADRFGKRVGTRDFEPSEYLGKPTAKLLTPGERVDATLQILDPGKNAEGFEIDVCLRRTDQKIACANDVAPQGKR